MQGNMWSTYGKMMKHGTQTMYIGANVLSNYIKGRKYQKKADAAKPPLVDQQEASFLNDIQMRRKNIDTGVGYATQERQADQLTAETQGNVLKAGGGDVGATINGLMLAARMGSQAFNEGAVTQASQQQNMYTQMAGGLVSKIADRKMQLQLADRAQYLAQAMNYKQQSQAQMTQLVNHMMDTDSAGLSGFGSGSGTNQDLNNPGKSANSSSSSGSSGGLGSILKMGGGGKSAPESTQNPNITPMALGTYGAV